MKYNKNEYTKDRPTRTNYFRLEIWCFYVGWPFLYVGAMQKAEFIVIAQFYHKLMWLCALFCCSKKSAQTHTVTISSQMKSMRAMHVFLGQAFLSDFGVGIHLLPVPVTLNMLTITKLRTLIHLARVYVGHWP